MTYKQKIDLFKKKLKSIPGHLTPERMTKDNLMAIFGRAATHFLRSSLIDEEDIDVKRLRKARKQVIEKGFVRAAATGMFECKPEQIAQGFEQLRKDTKVYIGGLFRGIFSDYPGLKRIYVDFPEREVEIAELSVGGKTRQELTDAIIAGEKEPGGFELIGDFEKPVEKILVVQLQVRDLFSDEDDHSIDDVYKRAKELGLKPCPIEVVPYYWLKIINQYDGDEECYRYIVTEREGGAGNAQKIAAISHYQQDTDLMLSVVDYNYEKGYTGDKKLLGPAFDFVFCLPD